MPERSARRLLTPRVSMIIKVAVKRSGAWHPAVSGALLSRSPVYVRFTLPRVVKTSWVRIRNQVYSQIAGRRELFEQWRDRRQRRRTDYRAPVLRLHGETLTFTSPSHMPMPDPTSLVVIASFGDRIKA